MQNLMSTLATTNIFLSDQPAKIIAAKPATVIVAQYLYIEGLDKPVFLITSGSLNIFICGSFAGMSKASLASVMQNMCNLLFIHSYKINDLG